MATGPHPEVLREIASDRIDLAIWERDLDPALVREVSGLDLDSIDDLLLVCDAGDTDMQLGTLLRDSGYPESPLLCADIAALAMRHGVLLGESRVGIRLEVVETDACRKFHADFVTVRTITTYRGPGTQWQRADDPGDQTINEMRSAAVGLFKGRLLQPEPSVLHRSPPIADSGESRLVLVIDSIGSG
ncbi:MAG: DUF1826 domain-containing protein [Novosphingobium sp.]|nr:DUF1826 domain-containing protein [Novosphingobium sp.]